MARLRYSINITLDGCCDHNTVGPDAESHAYWAESLTRSDALLFGRVTYQMMEEAWRLLPSGVWPEWMDDADIAFAQVIDGAKKYVVSSTLGGADWNAVLLRGDPVEAVAAIKAEHAGEIFVGGVTLPLELAQAGLIDDYEFVVHPVIAGRGPTLFHGLPEQLQLRLTGRREFASGAVALSYTATR